ncbi:hypothetical protein FZEAL_9447 [Fusarium zealandicum]|uniref:N-acetyltransferase domain-containing protein n=1 Tax=Fusarium zealandicum TaxID=1053134 RepID=A0A8H4UBF5_9HYPO|nr:hypothetical protein FZEAL_9447 [Fusarium zealandicum]
MRSPAFFVLASLPFLAMAQEPSVAINPTTTSSEEPAPLFPFSDAITTSSEEPAPLFPFVDATAISSSEPVVEPPVEESSTETSITVSESTTTTEELIPEETTTSEQPPELPVKPTTTTSELPIDVTTTTTSEQLPESTTTTTEQLPETTTSTAEGQAEPTTTTTEAGGEVEPTITDAPVLTTATGAAAISSVSSASTEVAGLIPIINLWKDDPVNLKDETLNKVDEVKDHVVAVIKGLGGNINQGCNSKRKRGLLGPIGDIINSLICIVTDLTDITRSIVVRDVTSVTNIVTRVETKNEELTDKKNKEDENEDDKSTEEKTDVGSATEQKPTTEEPTKTTESTTTAEESTTTSGAAITPCASDTCGGTDACPMGQLPLSGAEMALISTKVDCDAISTITTSELPTGYGTLNEISVAKPTPRPDSIIKPVAKRELSARAFGDNTSPNPNYVGSLSPFWVSQAGFASGHWFDYPETGQGVVGVNGIYGCTAVIIASEKGVYLSHIWENPVFVDEDWNPSSDEYFNQNAFVALRDGTSDAQSVTDLIGDEANPGVLNAIYAPKVFVLTPFTTIDDPVRITTELRYQDRAQQLADNLARAIPGSGGSGYLLGYLRTTEELSTMEYGWLGRAIFEVDLLQSVLTSPNDSPDSLGLRVGRWRLWVEDKLITYQDFWIPDRASQGVQKRQEDDSDACLIGSGGTSTEATSATSTDSTTTESSETTETTQSTETTETTQTTENAETTTETTTTESTAESTTESTEGTETSLDSTRPPTTLQTSTITTTSAPDTTSDEETSTTEDSFTGPYPCNNVGGPRVATPHCTCSTTSKDQQFFTSASLISGHCTDYTTFPGEITLRPTEAPKPTPWVTTMDDGAILSYPDQFVQIGQISRTLGITRTLGQGTPVTLRPAKPTQTSANNEGSSDCYTIDDACQRAIVQFDDDFIYTEFASYFARIQSGWIRFDSLGQAGCLVEFNCNDWSQGGLNGRQIKDAYQFMMDNNEVGKCGISYLSNSCYVSADFCTDCMERHQAIKPAAQQVNDDRSGSDNKLKGNNMGSWADIRDLARSNEDFEQIWQMWHTIFPKWPVERQRLQKLLQLLPGHHYIHDKGFCLSFLEGGSHGKLAAVGVLPEYRRKGLGSAFVKRARDGLKDAARANGEEELKSLEIGSQTPRFWPQMPTDFAPEVKDFFLNRGFRKSTEPAARDLFKDTRDDIAPPEILEKVSKMTFKFAPWSPELYEECMAKQQATFTWARAYEITAAYQQHHEVLVAFDPETNAQIGWTLMCSYSAIISDTFAFLPLMPTKEKTGLIAAVGVDKSARGKGVGLALMVKAMENMRERGVKGVFIDYVVIDGFYERLGFETYWQYERYVS